RPKTAMSSQCRPAVRANGTGDSCASSSAGIPASTRVSSEVSGQNTRDRVRPSMTSVSPMSQTTALGTTVTATVHSPMRMVMASDQPHARRDGLTVTGGGVGGGSGTMVGTLRGGYDKSGSQEKETEGHDGNPRRGRHRRRAQRTGRSEHAR